MNPTSAKSWICAPLVLLLACGPDAGEAPALRRADGQLREVIFSPQPPETSHNARVAELIAGAQRSIDVAMYSFSDVAVRDALIAAAGRGVVIRFIYEGAKDDRELTGDALAGSRSGRLEAAGIDVRYVNPIMHHKFMIIDGPRAQLDAAEAAIVVTGSANWSLAAATRYDENTLFLRGNPEIALRMQDEFNLLWAHSRDFEYNDSLEFEPTPLVIDEDGIIDFRDVDVLFTSDNFDIDDDTFSPTERARISDALIAAIDAATESIRIASGHLRHAGIAEALMAKARERPDMDIRVYLDAQEYVSATAQERQLDELDDCLAQAGDDPAARRDCIETGFRFGLTVAQAGVDVRYKWYSYRWSYPLARQMHHKYLIIDGDELWTGSYNLSYNAEHNTIENMLWFAGPEYAGLIGAFEGNFEALWTTGRDALAGLREEIATADEIPLTFEPLALDWQEVTDLQALIRANCPRVFSPEFYREPGAWTVCRRD